MKPKCKYGNHRWDPSKPKEESSCLDCKKEYGTRPSKKKKPPDPASDAPAAPAKVPNEALRAKWGLKPPQPEQPAQTAQPAQPAQTAQMPPAAEKSEKVDVTELVKEGIPDLVIGAEEKVIHMFGREPNPPHEKLEAKFKECLEKCATGKLPKIEVSPGWGAFGFALALLAQMWIGADPLPKKRPVPGKTSVADTDETNEPASTSSPQSSPLIPPLSLVPDDGAAIGADQSASDD
jgi:hypothetical protein